MKMYYKSLLFAFPSQPPTFGQLFFFIYPEYTIAQKINSSGTFHVFCFTYGFIIESIFLGLHIFS